MAENHVTLDTARRERLGIDEAVFCAAKSTEQISVILERFAPAGATALLTRLSQEQLRELPVAQRERLDYDPVSRTAFVGEVAPPEGEPQVAVVSAGTSDVGVAREAVRTLGYHGAGALEVYDVGVAGLWRLLDRIGELREMRVVIAVAGMDAALPSVIGGQVPGAVIAVPTSVGYGVAEGGGTALNAALASCAPGVTVVNIDNGYGAACAALRILRP
jgi:NCAIR mutase (PurE)-related protein